MEARNFVKKKNGGEKQQDHGNAPFASYGATLALGSRCVLELLGLVGCQRSAFSQSFTAKVN